MTNPCQYIHLCKTSDVWEGVPIKVEKDGQALAVFNINNQFFVTDDACTHGPGSLSEGEIEGENVTCNFHNGVFNVRTGAVVAAPCTVALKTYAVQVEADNLSIVIK